jgi:hypothetical protein
MKKIIEFVLRLFSRRKPSLDGPLKGKWVRRVVYHRAPE